MEQRTFRKILLKRFQTKTVTYPTNLHLPIDQLPLEKKSENWLSSLVEERRRE